MRPLKDLLSGVTEGLEIVLNGPESVHQAVGRWSAKTGRISEPLIEIAFLLADSPEGDVYTFKSSSWAFAFDLMASGALERLAEIGGPAKATLELEEVSFVARNGARRGQQVKYMRPVLTVQGAA